MPQHKRQQSWGAAAATTTVAATYVELRVDREEAANVLSDAEVAAAMCESSSSSRSTGRSTSSSSSGVALTAAVAAAPLAQEEEGSQVVRPTGKIPVWQLSDIDLVRGQGKKEETGSVETVRGSPTRRQPTEKRRVPGWTSSDHVLLGRETDNYGVTTLHDVRCKRENASMVHEGGENNADLKELCRRSENETTDFLSESDMTVEARQDSRNEQVQHSRQTGKKYPFSHNAGRFKRKSSMELGHQEKTTVNIQALQKLLLRQIYRCQRPQQQQQLPKRQICVSDPSFDGLETLHKKVDTRRSGTAQRKRFKPLHILSGVDSSSAATDPPSLSYAETTAPEGFSPVYRHRLSDCYSSTTSSLSTSPSSPGGGEASTAHLSPSCTASGIPQTNTITSTTTTTTTTTTTIETTETTRTYPPPSSSVSHFPRSPSSPVSFSNSTSFSSSSSSSSSSASSSFSFSSSVSKLASSSSHGSLRQGQRNTCDSSPASPRRSRSSSHSPRTPPLPSPCGPYPCAGETTYEKSLTFLPSEKPLVFHLSCPSSRIETASPSVLTNRSHAPSSVIGVPSFNESPNSTPVPSFCMRLCGRSEGVANKKWSVLGAARFFGAVFMWYTSSLLLTASNKYLFDVLGVPLPITLTFLHFSFVSIGLHLLVCSLKRLFLPTFASLSGTSVVRLLLPAAICAAGDVALTNSSFRLLPLSAITLIKSSSVFFIYILSVISRLESFRMETFATLVLIMVSICLTVPEMQMASSIGVAVMSTAVLAGALRWTLVQRMLRKYQSLSVTQLLLLLQPLSSICLSPAVLFYELPPLLTAKVPPGGLTFASSECQRLLAAALVAGGSVVAAAFILFAEVTLVDQSSSVSLCVAGVGKEVLTISMSVILFGEVLPGRVLVGIVASIIGVLYYAYIRYKLASEEVQPA